MQKIKHLEGGKTVLNFTVAENNYYKPKDADGFVQDTTYYECSWWRNPKAAERLTKGSLIEATGRFGARGYIDHLNEVRAVLTVNVDSFQILYRAKADQVHEDSLPTIEDFQE